MADQWVVLELNSKADKEDPDIVRKAICNTVKGADVFIPAEVTQVGGDRVVHYLVEGYAFIRHKHPDTLYKKLENSKFVSTVLTRSVKVNGSRVQKELATVREADIEKMRRQMFSQTDQGIGLGDTVLITSGAYKQITAKIIEEIPEEDKVQLHIQLRSKDTIVALPRSFLKLVSKAERLPFVDKMDAIKMWFGDYVDAIHLPIADFDLSEIRNAAQRLTKLLSYVEQVGNESLLDVSELTSRHDSYQVLTRLNSKLDNLRDSVISLERKITGKKGMDNIIIDGLNLVCRVHYAPGMAQLTDSKNRPTGVLLGFLRSVGALKKRYPGANVYVCWDGSSRRRKAQFGGYKANRKPSPVDWDQVEWLRKNLPAFGVHQAINADEEADDVIASLVRGSLKGYNNLIVSTDRDLLQLVTPTDSVLTPAQGKGSETIYDPKQVEAKWGVQPEKMVELRALDGDLSDDIPGVATVPTKVLVELLGLYGNIAGIYASNLAGLTRKRFECIQAAKRQVLINRDLMRLQTVPFDLTKGEPDQVLAISELEERDIDPTPMKTAFFA